MSRKPLNKKIIPFILCILIMVFSAVQAIPVSSEEGNYDSGGGKHNSSINVDPIGQDEGYSAVLYNNKNGLPTSEANDIVQTSEGFIWIGCYSGLIRYDGSHFERIIDATSSVKCLYVDSKDRLWIGTNDDGVSVYENGLFYEWDMMIGMKSNTVRSITEDDKGNIYVATTIGLAIIDQDRQLSYPEDKRLSEAFIQEVRTAADGTVYCVNNDGDLITCRDGKLLKYYELSKTELKGINCMLPDPEEPGSLYMESRTNEVFHGSPEDDPNDYEHIDISPLYQLDSFECFDGDIWICARNGIGVIRDDGFHELKNVPMDSSIGHMMTDYEGNLWFTSTREGVMKIVNNRFTDIFDRYELPKRVVNSTCIYDDDLYIATDTGLIVLDEDKVVSKVPLNSTVVDYEGNKTDDLLKMLENCRIRSMIRDSQDRLWISTWRRYGLLCYDHGDLQIYNTDNGMTIDAIRTVYECKDGSILVAGNGGVNVIRDGEVVASYDEKDGIFNTDLLNVTEGENGDIIVGSDGGGIFIISVQGTKHLGYAEGLHSNSVMRIKKSRYRDLYWIVTGNTIAYMNDRYELTSIETFPYSNNFDLYENSKNELWVLSSDGIYIVQADEMLKDEGINAVHYTMSDGLPCIATANSYSELTDDHDLYIAGATGVAKVNIEAPYDSITELRFSIPYVAADNDLIFPDEQGRFIIPSDTTRLTIYGYTFTYSLVEPFVYYQLNGLDEDVFVENASTAFPVYYTSLPGGNYTFDVELRYSPQEESLTTSVEIIKEKALFENTWFYIASVSSFLAIAFGAITYYIDRREQKLINKHKEQSEKERIASELSMGYNIQRSMLPHIFPPFPDREEFELYASMDPAREVGGDFYDFFLIDDDHLCLVMADVSGKGIPGALFMMVSKTILHNIAMFDETPAEILKHTNESICSSNTEQMFVTVWLGILEISTGKLIAANAGHEYPIVKSPDGNFEILKDRHGLVIGGMENVTYQDYELVLEPGSKIFLYTDGVPEATDRNEELFGMERLVEALNASPDDDPEQILKNVRAAVDRFVKGNEQFDDLTMLCIEYKGKTNDNKESQQ